MFCTQTHFRREKNLLVITDDLEGNYALRFFGFDVLVALGGAETCLAFSLVGVVGGGVGGVSVFGVGDEHIFGLKLD